MPRPAVSLRRYALPSPVDLVFILFLFAVPLVRGWQVVNTDGDLGRHLRVGETILSEGALFHTDRFSHTMAGEPFVPYEWLSEVLFAVVHRLAGLAGVVVLTGLILAATYGLVAWLLQRHGVSPLAAMLTAVAAGAVGAVHWLARPHLFTLLGAVLTLWLLERGNRRAWPAAALFALWANLHGGFLYGLVLIALVVAGDLAEARWGSDRERWLGGARGHLVMLGAALAGTLVTPAGPALLRHVVGYLGKSYLVDNTAEYQSPDFHAVYGRVFLVILIGAIAALALSGRRPTYPRLLLVLANIAFALMSIRNIPLFGVIALPAIALHLAGRSGSAGPAPRTATAGAVADLGTGAWSAAALLAVGLMLASPARGLFRASYDPAVFPVAAVGKAREARLGGRLFNHFEWGGYVLYAWPEQRVFIDGQTDFYGERLTREYAALAEAGAGWRRRLSGLGISLVLLPPGAPLARALGAVREWEEWYRDGTAVVLRRKTP